MYYLSNCMAVNCHVTHCIFSENCARQGSNIRVGGEFVQIVVLVEGVVVPQVDELLQGLVNEDDADERGKGFLREACDVTHQGAGIGGHQDDAEDSRPQADAGPQRQIG